jgi:hypothetical protein
VKGKDSWVIEVVPMFLEMALPITVDVVDGGGGIELSAEGIKNKAQVGLEVGKCVLVD